MVKMDWLKRIVFHIPRYYAMTIAENVLMRKVDKEEDRAAVREALEKADLWSYVEQLPEKMGTMLTREFDSEGMNLSGGQGQKLALARMFAQKEKEMDRIYYFENGRVEEWRRWHGYGNLPARV